MNAGDVISDISGTLRDYVLDSLGLVATVSFDSLRALGTQSWLADGLDSEEAAFITAISEIPVGSPELYLDLLDTHFTQASTVPLPLAGDVRIWVFSDEPFNLGENHRPLIRDTALAFQPLPPTAPWCVRRRRELSSGHRYCHLPLPHTPLRPLPLPHGLAEKH